MKKKSFFCFWLYFNLAFCLVAINVASHAQMTMDVMPNARPMDPAVIIYGGSGLDGSIPYSKIQGSPFWNDDYQVAALFSENDKEKWMMRVKLNLTSGEIYFINKGGEEQVTPEGLVKKIIFYSYLDHTKPVAVFRYNYGEPIVINKLNNYFVQVMNEGNCQLLKYNKKPVMSADSFHIAKRYFFKDDIKYFVQNNNRTAAVKKLTRENIAAYLPGAGAYNDWVEQNKINFKKEEDVVRFLDYYNSKKQ